MTRTLMIAAAALSLAACATAQEAPPAATPGVGTLEGWTAGNAQYLVVNGTRRGWTTSKAGHRCTTANAASCARTAAGNGC